MRLCYPVLTPFKFRGVIVKPPAFIELSAAQVAPLIDLQVIGAEAVVVDEETDTLLGSDAFGALITIGGVDVSLGDVVAAAHRKSGLTIAQWNELPPAERDAQIQSLIDYALALEAHAEAVAAQSQPPEADAAGDEPTAAAPEPEQGSQSITPDTTTTAATAATHPGLERQAGATAAPSRANRANRTAANKTRTK